MWSLHSCKQNVPSEKIFKIPMANLSYTVWCLFAVVNVRGDLNPTINEYFFGEQTTNTDSAEYETDCHYFHICIFLQPELLFFFTVNFFFFDGPELLFYSLPSIAAWHRWIYMPCIVDSTYCLFLYCHTGFSIWFLHCHFLLATRT